MLWGDDSVLAATFWWAVGNGFLAFMFIMLVCGNGVRGELNWGTNKTRKKNYEKSIVNQAMLFHKGYDLLSDTLLIIIDTFVGPEKFCDMGFTNKVALWFTIISLCFNICELVRWMCMGKFTINYIPEYAKDAEGKRFGWYKVRGSYEGGN